MKSLRNAAVSAVIIFSFFATAAGTQIEETPGRPRPLELQDILAWKSIGAPTISPDGAWLAYRLSPVEGDSEVVVRRIRDDREWRFPAGDAPSFVSGRDIAFSEDGSRLCFLSHPTTSEAKKMRKERKRIQTRAVLVELASGEKTEFQAVRGFSFSGENPGWLALHKYVPESQEKEKDAWTGSDLILRELRTGKDIVLGNIAEFAFDRKGRRLALAVDTFGGEGNGVQIRDMTTGALFALDSGKASYKGLTWSEKGEGLAFLKGVEDKAFEDKLQAVLGFSGFEAGAGKIRKIHYDPKDDPAFPAGMTISSQRAPRWTESLDGLVFGIAESKKKAGAAAGNEEKKAETPVAAPDDEEIPGLVVWHWLDRRLQSQQQVEERRDAAFSFLSVYRAEDNRFIRLADDDLRRVEAAPRDRWAVGLDNSPYELDGNLDGRRHQDVYAVDMATGGRKKAIENCRWYFGSSPDGTRLLYYRDRHFHVYDMSSGRSVNITADVPVSFVNEEDDHNVIDPPRPPVGWTKDGLSVLLSDGWDVWNVPAGKGRAVNLTADGRTGQIRYQSRIRLDPEEKGIDPAVPQYFSVYGEWTKKTGIARIEKGRPGASRLLWDDAVFSRLQKARKADVYLYTRETSGRFPDYYAADAMLKNGRRLTKANPQQSDFLWSSGARLVDYTSAKGARLQAALFLPAGYEEGKSYPTLVYIYEKLSQSLNRYLMPSPYGFNASAYTSRGYAVLMPDIVYTINDPGMSAVWCVLPALDAAVATGVVDKTRVGLQGHSWGGYQTSFLITQTDAFAAAAAGAPLTNMISMYSSIDWNTGSATQPIFESSQGRFTGGYWENLEAYARNSPVYFVEKVVTPLLLLHNDKDGAVDWNQGIEYFNTLRRLKKPVVMLQYTGENHGLRKPPNRKDYGVRMREFFDHHLLGGEAPDWLSEGVSHLDLKDHLKERAKDLILKDGKPKPEDPKAEKSQD